MIYYAEAKRSFHTIRIDIRTDIIEAVGFEGGIVFVELHFQKSYKHVIVHVRFISLR